MGISGLLQMLKPVMKPITAQEYRGRRIAVDAMCWLHRGACACAYEVVTHQPTTRYLEFCIRHVRVLKDAGVVPVMVFDGGSLPIKEGTRAGRAKRRKDALTNAQAVTERSGASHARKFYVQAIDITTEMVRSLIEVLKAEAVEYLVAPYEADAQLAWMALNDVVDAVISEDSDLLAFGCRSVIYKFDEYGSGQLIEIEQALQHLKNIPLDLFQITAVLSGCDYLPSVPGIGLKKALQLVEDHRGALSSIFRFLRLTKRNVPDGYEEDFRKALNTFRHQCVFSTTRRMCVHLNDYMEDEAVEVESLTYLGDLLPASLAQAVAEGRADPHSHEDYGPPPPLPVLRARSPAGRQQPLVKALSAPPAGRSATSSAPRSGFLYVGSSSIALSASSSALKQFRAPSLASLKKEAPPPPTEPQLATPAVDFDLSMYEFRPNGGGAGTPPPTGPTPVASAPPPPAAPPSSGEVLIEELGCSEQPTFVPDSPVSESSHVLSDGEDIDHRLVVEETPQMRPRPHQDRLQTNLRAENPWRPSFAPFDELRSARSSLPPRTQPASRRTVQAVSGTGVGASEGGIRSTQVAQIPAKRAGAGGVGAGAAVQPRKRGRIRSPHDTGSMDIAQFLTVKRKPPLSPS